MNKQNVLTLISLQDMAEMGSAKAVGKLGNLRRAISVVGGLVLYGLYIAIVYFLEKLFFERNIGSEFLILATLVGVLIGIIACTGHNIKSLYSSGDNELLLRFPVSGMEIFMAKTIQVFKRNILLMMGTLLPIYIVFAASNPLVLSSPVGGQVGYYILSVLVAFMVSLVPYAIANIIAIPAMEISNFVKNKFFFLLLVAIALLCAGFVVYMKILSAILVYLQNNQTTLLSPQTVVKIQAFASYCYPIRFFVDILLGAVGLQSAKTAGLAFLYQFLIIGALIGLGLFISKKTYYRTVLESIESSKATLFKKRNYRVRPVFETILRREWFMIFRSFNYSFQYLAMAVAAPIMVYFCDSLAINYGRSTIGTLIVPGITLMIIILFSTVIVSFASTTISREGDCFYQTKIIPVSYQTQVGAKLLLYSIVATLSAMVSCFAVGLAFGPVGSNVIKNVDIVAIFFISELVILGLTCTSIKLDVVSPKFNLVGDGEMVSANKNVALVVFIGVFVAIIFGILSTIFAIIPMKIGNWTVIQNSGQMYGFLAFWAALLFIIPASILFPTLSKDYIKISP